VDPIVKWLKHHVGLNVWYDATTGDASKLTTELLAEAITSSRGAIFFLSSAWLESTWTRSELNLALTERRKDDAFLVLAVRVDDCDLPPWFEIAEVLDFRDLESQSCARLLRSLSPNPPTRFDAEQDVYLSAPWSRQTDATRNALHSIAARGWRLVGDSPNHPHFADSAERIAWIIATSRGAIVVLPFDQAKPPSFTSPYILEEAHIASNIRQSYLLLAESGVEVPNELVLNSFGQRVTVISSDTPGSSIHEVLSDFDEELSRKPFIDTGTYSFLATSLLAEDTDDLSSVMQHASNITCMQGQRLIGQHVQQQIIERIRGAAFVLADVTDDHRNSLIEAGIAMGAGRPLHLMCKIPEGGSRHRRFMFESLEMNWYRDAVERLAIAYRISSLYRRRVYSLRNSIHKSRRDDNGSTN